MSVSTLDDSYRVYKIHCVPSNKSYIGISKNDIEKRWHRHVLDAKKGKIKNALQGAINKYGENNFNIQTLYIASSELEARITERGIIAQYGTMWPMGYNMTGGGEKLPKLVYSIEYRQRLSESRKGRKVMSQDKYKELGLKRRGWKHSQETIEKMRATARVKNHRPSEEAIRKSCDVRRGKPLSDNRKEAIRQFWLGRKRGLWSEERKLSYGLKRRKTICKRGHPLNNDNRARTNGGCKKCGLLRNREYWREKHVNTG